MYSVSESYKNALLQKHITDTVEGEAVLKDGTVIALNDDTVISGSLKIVHELCDDYRIGGFNLGCMKIGFFDDSALLHDFSGAKITLSYKIKTDDGWEKIPLGIYIADGQSVKRRRNTITLNAYDYGILFDCTLGSTIRSMSGTVEEIAVAVCERCGVEFDGIAEGLPNMEIILTPSSEQIQSCRDLIGWIADLVCGYAVIDREGKLKIISARYSVSADDPTEIITDKIITEAERNSIYSTDTRAWISRMSAHSGAKTKVYKSNITMDDSQAARAVYYLDKNPLLDDKTESECDEINCEWLEFVDSFMQRGVTAELYGDPAIDAGDIIRCSGGDIDQRKSIVGLITRQEWNYRGFHNIICASAQLSDGFEESENEEESSSETETVGETDEIYPVKVVDQSEKRIGNVKTSGSGVGVFISNGVNEENNAERFNDYSEEALALSGGLYSHAEGRLTRASAYSSHAEGQITEATGDESHAEGLETKATNTAAHSEGRKTSATGAYSHAEGYGSTAVGSSSHAEGESTEARSACSHAEGIRSTASGHTSHAEGYETTASGAYSHAGGYGTIASGFYQTAIGRYNFEDENALFIIGNGESDTERKNVFKVDGEGNVHVYGNLTVDGTGGGETAVYTAGNGISLSADNVISVNAGNGLEFDSSGRLSLKVSEEEEESGGTVYTAGTGIAITEGEESSEIAVDIDNDTITLDENGKLKAKGLTLENAVVITETDASYLLHEYTEVDYIDGNKVVYGSVGNPIILNGYMFYKNSSIDSNPKELPPYKNMVLDHVWWSTGDVYGYNFDLLIVKINDDNTANVRWQYYTNVTPTVESDEDGIVNYSGLTYAGWIPTWDVIYPPDDEHPFGYIHFIMLEVYRKRATYSYQSIHSTVTGYADFSSIAEYNAAVGLTYEPNVLTEVQETVTEV